MRRPGRFCGPGRRSIPTPATPPTRTGTSRGTGTPATRPRPTRQGVYAYFGSAGAVCYGHDGEKKWGPVRLGTKARAHTYGSGASPLLHENLLIVNAALETAELYKQGET